MRRRGFTIIEMIVALLIVSLLMGIAVVGVGSLTHAGLRSDAGRLAGAIRYVFTLSAAQNKYYRLVISIDDGRYWAEYSDNPFLLSLERTKVIDGAADKSEEEARKARREREKESLGGFTAAPAIPRMPEPGWTKVKGTDSLDEIKMGSSTKIEGIFTTHQTDLFTQGEAQIYFFPGGRMESFIIYLSDGKDNTYSLEGMPLTGKVQIHEEKIDIPPEYMEARGKEAEGEEI